MNTKTILVTAGPTHEYIDSVRFIGNASSGQMGYAIAETFAQRGAKVHLVSGPVNLTPKHNSIILHNVCSAKEMAERCEALFPECDIAVLTAAVADYTPLQTFDRKIKRRKEEWTLTLVPTQDIAAALGRSKRSSQILAGFALEDSSEIYNAQQKLLRKNLDLIVLNSLNDAGAGFNAPTNKITIIEKGGGITHYPLKLKTEVAEDIADRIAQYAAR